jgi:predicted ATPase
MSRYRSTRPDPRSKLTAPYLRRIAAVPERVEAGRFPFTLPFMRHRDFALEFTHPVTFLVGEKRHGKIESARSHCAQGRFQPARRQPRQ